MEIIDLPTDSLMPYPKNPKAHPGSQIDKIVASIREFKFLVPLVVNEENMVIAGHGRLEAAKKMKMAKVPCIQARHLNEAQMKAFRIADNRTAQSDWLFDMLQLEINDLKSIGYDLDLLGFDIKEMDKIINFEMKDLKPRIENTEELMKKWETEQGQLWEIEGKAGKHKLLCGDSTNKDDVTRLMGSAEIHLMTTDPPYGVQTDHSWRKCIKRRACREETLLNDDRVEWGIVWELYSPNILYVWHGARDFYKVAVLAEEKGYEIKDQIIWVKSMSLNRKHYNSCHESCFYALKKGTKSDWQKRKDQKTVWEFDSPIQARGRSGSSKDETSHPTQKPIEIFKIPILNHTKIGGYVVDPFLGSGTAMVAAEQIERICYAMELDPRYVAVSLERMSGMGLFPKLAK